MFKSRSPLYNWWWSFNPFAVFHKLLLSSATKTFQREIKLPQNMDKYDQPHSQGFREMSGTWEQLG